MTNTPNNEVEKEISEFYTKFTAENENGTAVWATNALTVAHWLSSKLTLAHNQGREEAMKQVVEKLESFFTPATGSRGQGGLPLTGSVKDWNMCVTKDGWEMFKSSLEKDSGK